MAQSSFERLGERALRMVSDSFGHRRHSLARPEHALCEDHTPCGQVVERRLAHAAAADNRHLVSLAELYQIPARRRVERYAICGLDSGIARHRVARVAH